MREHSQRTARERFRLLYTLLHALVQLGATALEAHSKRPVDPRSAVMPPEGDPVVE